MVTLIHTVYLQGACSTALPWTTAATGSTVAHIPAPMDTTDALPVDPPMNRGDCLWDILALQPDCSRYIGDNDGVVADETERNRAGGIS